MISVEAIQALQQYPVEHWGAPTVPEFWTAWCDALFSYTPPDRHLKLVNPNRKWELVSSYQKAIRRGNKVLALPLVSAMASQPGEWPYFVRRLTIISIEDVGPAAPDLVLFVFACVIVFTPTKTGPDNLYAILCFLTGLLCDLPNRSRVYCALVIIEQNLATADLPALSSWETDMVDWMALVSEQVESSQRAFGQWKHKNKWRGEGLLKYCREPLPFSLTEPATPIWDHVTFYGLPSFGYDMYTRVGKQVIRQLIARNPRIADLCRPYRGLTKINDAVGESLFFVEGGRIRGELTNPQLYLFEQKMLSSGFGIQYPDWVELRAAMERALQSGQVDEIRFEVLQKTY